MPEHWIQERKILSIRQPPCNLQMLVYSHLNGDGAWCALGEDEAKVARSRDERILIRGLRLILQNTIWEK